MPPVTFTAPGWDESPTQSGHDSEVVLFFDDFDPRFSSDRRGSPLARCFGSLASGRSVGRSWAVESFGPFEGARHERNMWGFGGQDNRLNMLSSKGSFHSRTPLNEYDATTWLDLGEGMVNLTGTDLFTWIPLPLGLA